MKAFRTTLPGTAALLVALVSVFLVEVARHAAGDEMALLSMGALPNDGRLHGEYWRLITSSFLHLNWGHLLTNAALLWFTGRIVERRVGTLQGAGIYFASVILSSAAILLLRGIHPKAGSTLGASGGIFGLLAAALVLAYRPAAVAEFGRNPRMRLGLWIAMAVGIGISLQPGVSMMGHVGGLVAGAPLGALAKVRPRRVPSTLTATA